MTTSNARLDLERGGFRRVDGHGRPAPVARTDASNASVRERAFAALLLLVGGAAIAYGLLSLFGTETLAPIAMFDAILGGAVLLVTWLFVVPTVWPRWVGAPQKGRSNRAMDLPPNPTAAHGSPPPPGGTRSVRPPLIVLAPPIPRPNDLGELTAAPAPPPPVAKSTPPAIPKWADPLVIHPADGGSAKTHGAPVRPEVPFGAPRGLREYGLRSPPRFAATYPPPATEEIAESPEVDDEGAWVSSASDPAPVAIGEHAPSVLRELDLISAELRPLAQRSAARTANVDPRSAGPADPDPGDDWTDDLD